MSAAKLRETNFAHVLGRIALTLCVALMCLALGMIVFSIVVINVSEGGPMSGPPQQIVGNAVFAVQGQCPASHPVKVSRVVWYNEHAHYYLPDFSGYKAVEAFACYESENAAQVAGYHRERILLDKLTSPQVVIASAILIAFFAVGLGLPSRNRHPAYISSLAGAP